MYVCVFSIQSNLLDSFYGEKKLHVYVSASHWFCSCKQNLDKRAQMMSYMESSETLSQHQVFGADDYFLKTEYFIFFAILDPERSMNFNRGR